MYPGGWAPICQPSDGPLCVLITQPHVLDAFGWVAGIQYPGDRTKEQWFRVWEGNRLGKMPGILPVLPASNSYVTDFHIHLQLPLLAPPQTSPPTTAIANGGAYFGSIQSWALASARDYLEKRPLSLMRWVLHSRQRKLMTTATLLTSISPDCSRWHLKPRLDRRAHCLFDLYSLPP